LEADVAGVRTAGRESAFGRRRFEGGQWANFTPNYFGDFLGMWDHSPWNAVAVGTNGAVWAQEQ